MASHLDEVAAELRQTLRDTQPFTLPISVKLTTGEDAAKLPSGTPPVSPIITVVEPGGILLELAIRESPLLKLSDVRRETVRLLLAERIVRGHQTLPKQENRLLLPDWLFTGVIQAMDYRAASRPTTMFAAIFRSGKIYGIEEIIEASPTQMDNLSRSIYETSCAALVMSLVDQPNGAQRFNTFLSSLAGDARTERELLNEAFPGFGASASSLNKWWSLQLATLAKRGMAEPLGPDESLRELENAITVHYHALPADVPKNIKMRPFVIPAPLNVIPAPQPKAKPEAASEGKVIAKSSPVKKDEKTEEKPEEKSEEKPEVTEEKKKSTWLRYLTFGLMGDKKSEESPETKPEEKDNKVTVAEDPLATKTVKEESVTSEEPSESKPGFFARLLARNNLRAAEERQKLVDEKAKEEAEKEEKAAKAKAEKELASKPKTEVVKEEKPAKAKDTQEIASKTKPTATKETQPEEKTEEKAEKRSSLNPLNWFRSGKKEDKKEDEKKSDAKPEKKESEQAAAISVNDILAWYSPSMADAWQLMAPTGPQHTILDFLKRKKKEEATPEPTPPPAPVAKPKKETKSSNSPPKQTNPNAKPAAKPVRPTDGSQRTTNPAAKPKPAPVLPPATTKSDDDISPVPAGMVLVTLPLEEYAHILKRPDHKDILARNVTALRALQLRSCVLFRPVATAYLSVVLELQEGKTKDMDKKLAILRQAAIQALQNTKAVRDYIDYYEANETGRLSGKFDDFLNLPAIIKRELPPRQDPISKYLDAIDKEFSK